MSQGKGYKNHKCKKLASQSKTELSSFVVYCPFDNCFKVRYGKAWWWDKAQCDQSGLPKITKHKFFCWQTSHIFRIMENLRRAIWKPTTVGCSVASIAGSSQTSNRTRWSPKTRLKHNKLSQFMLGLHKMIFLHFKQHRLMHPGRHLLSKVAILLPRIQTSFRIGTGFTQASPPLGLPHRRPGGRTETD